jgi:ribonuclease HI
MSFGINDLRNESREITEPPFTNRRAKLHAVLHAMEYVLSLDVAPRKLQLWTDSQDASSCAHEWSEKWERSDWKNVPKSMVPDVDLIRAIADAKARLSAMEVDVNVTQCYFDPELEPEDYEASTLARRLALQSRSADQVQS